MKKILLLGDEAIAQGAIDAGLSGVYAYPGTPSTEIMEFIQGSKDARERSIRALWSSNEKTAMECALGMSYSGKRSMVCMKHVGLNVAADPFINSSITGVNGGMVVLVADDPSMHSSQDEQDSRTYGKFAMIPILEPSNQQEAYDMTRYAFDLSEKIGTPVMIRVTTRLAHSRSGVECSEKREQNELHLHSNLRQFVLLPAIAKKQYKSLLSKQSDMEQESMTRGFNQYFDGADKSKGIITCGLAYNYLKENFNNEPIPYPVLKICQYPLPVEMIKKIYDECDELVVMEEGYPIVEDMIKGVLNNGKTIHGRTDGTLPRDGELNPNLIAIALGMPNEVGAPIPELVKARPPKLCDGCPHWDSFRALNEALSEYSKGRVFGDIGCYTLSAMPPLESINSTVDMGASITMAIGASEAGLTPAVACIGDSTFTHSGMTGLLDAVNNKNNIVVMILDNSTTGMTGGQKSSAEGRLESIVKGLGVEPEHVRVIKPLANQHDINVQIIKEELAYEGVSVIIPRRECIQTLSRRMRAKKAAEKK